MHQHRYASHTVYTVQTGDCEKNSQPRERHNKYEFLQGEDRSARGSCVGVGGEQFGVEGCCGYRCSVRVVRVKFERLILKYHLYYSLLSSNVTLEHRYESMIEELTQSDLEKGDRIAELEQIVEEMQEMEQLAQEESEELQSNIKDLRQELETETSKLYKMVPLVQDLRKRLEEREQRCEKFRVALSQLRSDREETSKKLKSVLSSTWCF